MNVSLLIARRYFSSKKKRNIISIISNISMIGVAVGTMSLIFVLLPFYYLVTFPFCLILNWVDANSKHDSGTGLIVKAWK